MRMSVEIDAVRTKFGRGPQRHCRMHTKLSRGVGSCGDYSPLIFCSPYNYRFSFERRIEQLLDGDEERVHVQMEDDAVGLHKDYFTMHRELSHGLCAACSLSDRVDSITGRTASEVANA